MDEQRAWLKMRRRKRLCTLAVALSVCVLISTYPNVLETLSVYAEGLEGENDGVYVLEGKEEEPEDGTDEEEIPGDGEDMEENGEDGSTKTVYIKDAEGNIYQTEFSYKLDKTPLVIDLSNMSVENGAKNLWNWIIGKKSMIIKIPDADITDVHSGIAKVTYTAIPDSGAAQTKTIRAQDSYYEIALNAEFSGTIKFKAEDRDGNITQVSLAADDGKIIAQDYAPEITTDAETGYYETTPAINVTVTDDKDDTISGGIASVSYRVDDEVTRLMNINTLQTRVVFTIPAAELPKGKNEIRIIINAKDNMGNSASKTMVIHIVGKEGGKTA